MSPLPSLAIVCLLFLTLGNPTVDGLACYVCTNCNDPFTPYNVPVQYYSDATASYCIKTSSSYNISRSIAVTCSPYGVSGAGQWCCQTNLCNGAKTHVLANVWAFSTGLVMLLIFF